MKLLDSFKYKIHITYIGGAENYFHRGDIYEIDEFIEICRSINANVSICDSPFVDTGDEYIMVIEDGSGTDVYFKIIIPFDKGFARDIEDSINR